MVGEKDKVQGSIPPPPPPPPSTTTKFNGSIPPPPPPPPSTGGASMGFSNASSEQSEGATREQSKVGTPSPSKTISFADFEVENPIDTTIDVSTIDISKYNKQYKPSTPIGGIKGATIGYNAGIVDGNTTLSPIVEQELPVGIINKNKVLPYKNKVDKTKVGTPNPSLLGSVRGAAIGSKAGIVEGNKTKVGTPSPYDIRKNSVKLEGQEPSQQPSQPSEESGIKQDILNKYPALKNVYGQQGENLVIDADTNFKPFEIGFGGIEFYAPEQSEITYGKGYSYKHPSKGKYAVKYNPEKAGGQDIFLDLLHGMDADPEYKKLREEFKKQTLKDRDGDIEYFYNKDKKEGFAEDGKERWIDNYVDGLIRSELAVGSEDYAKEASGNSKEMKAIASRLNDYLILQPSEERGSWKKEYKPRTSEINFPKMEEIPSMKNGITQNVRDVFTPANTTTTKPIIKEEKIKKIAEVAKNIDNEEDYSMFTESLSYIDGLLNSTIAESDKFRLRGSAAFEEIGDMILDEEEQLKAYASQEKKYYGNFISNIPSYVNRVLIQYGFKDQVVDESSITEFNDVERSTQPVDISQTNNETVQDIIPTNTQIFPKVKDNFWRSSANLDLKGNKKDSDIEYNLNVFRNVFDAVSGFTYAPIPSNGNTEAPEKLEGVSGVAHFFIRDGRPKEFKDVYDATNEDLKKESEWFKKGGYSDKDGYNTSNFKKLKNDQYVPVFNKTESGDLRISYKKKGDVTENDYVTQNLKQYNYGDINWKKTTTDKQYGKDIQVLSTIDGKSIPSLPVLGGETADGKKIKGQELYSRFSGSATVFLFEKDGKLIADDFSGSANNIKAEAERLSKDYDVPLNDITLAFYDAGSYSAKPAENSNGVLDRRQWVDYNVKLESGSGIGFKK